MAGFWPCSLSIWGDGDRKLSHCDGFIWWNIPASPQTLPPGSDWSDCRESGGTGHPQHAQTPPQQLYFLPPPAAPTSATHHQHTPRLGPSITLIPQDTQTHHFPHYIPHPCTATAPSGSSPSAPIAPEAIKVSPHPRGCQCAAAPTQGTAHGHSMASGTPAMTTRLLLHKLPGSGTGFVCVDYSIVLFNFICITNN